jgi:hypothetical protein
MEPIGLCGGGLVGLVIVLVLVVGAALFGGGLALALAKLGVIVDAWLKPDRRGEANEYKLQTDDPDRPGQTPDL